MIGGLCGVSKIVKFTVGFALMGTGAFTILNSFPGFVQNFRSLKAELSKEDKNYLNILHYGSGFISDTAGIIYGINSMYGGFTAMFGKCFVAGTKIKTEEGDKNIEDIEVGDRVYSYNPETGEEGYKTVKRTFIKESDEIVHVTITNADKSESVTIDATPGHPFYVVGYGFKYASELKIGDKLRSVSGDIYEVTDTEVEHFAIPIKVYNFEVEDWHTYAVSEVGIIVHNSKGYVESDSNEQATEQPSEPQPNTGTTQTTAQQGDVVESGRGVPNPYGKKGGPDHQQVIGDIKLDTKERGLSYETEFRFDSSGGLKNSRYADVVVFDSKGRVMEIHQVGKTTKKHGAPVARERKAIRDIRSSDDYNGAKIIYHPYDR